MKIGIIGAGNVGIGLGKRLAAAGHDIVVSFSKTQAALDEAAKKIGGGARGGTTSDAAIHGDVVIVATPWGVTLDAVQSLKADMSGLEIGLTRSAGEEIAKAADGAKVVKAVPPFAEVLQSPSTRIGNGRPGVFVCGDDPAARAVVLKLVSDVDAEGVDAGPLSLARYTEPLGMLLVQLAYVQGFGARIGSVLIRDPSGK